MRVAQDFNLAFSSFDNRVAVVNLGNAVPDAAVPVLHIASRKPDPSQESDGGQLFAVGIGMAAFIKTHGGDKVAPGRIVFEEIEATPQNNHYVFSLLHSACGIYSLSSDPSIPINAIGIRKGVVQPTLMPFKVTLLPAFVPRDVSETGTNTIQVLGHIITSLCQITTRRIDPLRPARIVMRSVSSEAVGGGVSVTLRGEVQCVNSEDIESISGLMETTVQGVSRAFATECEVTFESATPGVETDEQFTERFMRGARLILGSAGVVKIEFLRSDLTPVSSYIGSVPVCVVSLARPSGMSLGTLEEKRDVLTILETGVKSLAWAFVQP